MDIDRRDFLRQVAAWSAGMALAAPVLRVGASAMAAETAKAGGSVLSVAKGKDYAALVAAVLKPLGGIGAFVKKGDKVVVKPNIGWDRKPEFAANTNPDVVKAIVQQALAAGAAQVLVFDLSCNDPKRCYKNSGIEAAVAAIGDERAKCQQIDHRKWVPVTIEGAKSLKQGEFYKDALEADCYINVPIAKDHGASRLTLGFKNTMGVIKDRGAIHAKDLPQRIVDINMAVRPKLTIIDATRILLRGGPTGGNLNDVKVLDTLIASGDPVAADAYATTLFGLKPADVLTTRLAHEAGLGEMDLAKIRTVVA
jgi:uncharacterized protein (DUF362 family)